jgi:hypothetical protein
MFVTYIYISYLFIVADFSKDGGMGEYVPFMIG